MTMSNFEFTAFTEADMRASGARNGEYLSRGETFTMPGCASATLSVSDNDNRLSGDSRHNENANDRCGQETEIEVDGQPAGNGGQIYAEAYYWLRDQYGNWYVMIEIEQEGTGENYFTFYGDYGLPPAGAELTVYCRGNISCWEPRYDSLTAGEGKENAAPVANDDAFETTEDAAVTGDLLANDTDEDGDALTVSAVSFGEVGAPELVMTDDGDFAGVLIVKANGEYEFTPDAALNALGAGDVETVTFSYTIQDGNGGEATASVSIVIKGQNDAPVAIADTIEIAEDAALGAGPDAFAFNVLANDVDIDGDALTVASVGGLDAGAFVDVVTEGGVDARVAITKGGGVIFDAGDAFLGLAAGESDSFEIGYTISDGNGGTAAATARIVIDGINDAPEAMNDAIIIPEGGVVGPGDAATGFLNVLDNDRDPNGDTLTVALVGDAEAGKPVSLITADGRAVSVQILKNGVVLFDANDDFADLGADDFDSFTLSYTVRDEAGAVADGLVTIVIDGQGPGGASPLPDNFVFEVTPDMISPLVSDEIIG